MYMYIFNDMFDHILKQFFLPYTKKKKKKKRYRRRFQSISVFIGNFSIFLISWDMLNI